MDDDERRPVVDHGRVSGHHVAVWGSVRAGSALRNRPDRLRWRSCGNVMGLQTERKSLGACSAAFLNRGFSTEGVTMFSAVLMDLDGTLIDSNDAHAKAWLEAFESAGFDIPYERVRARIGMGGDHLIPTVLGLSAEDDMGKRIEERRGEIFRSKYLPFIKAFPGTRELLSRLRRRNLEIVVATSASREDLQALLAQTELDDVLTKFTSSDDVNRSKPAGDVVEAALKQARCRPDGAVLIGDTPYDIEAADRAGVKTIAFTCGGWSAGALARAMRIYEGPWHLARDFEQSPFAVQQGIDAVL